MQSKAWYQSKTIWANALAFAAVVAQYFGVEPVEFSGTTLAFIMTVLNIVLRFVTKQPLASPAKVNEA